MRDARGTLLTFAGEGGGGWHYLERFQLEALL